MYPPAYVALRLLYEAHAGGHLKLSENKGMRPCREQALGQLQDLGAGLLKGRNAVARTPPQLEYNVRYVGSMFRRRRAVPTIESLPPSAGQ